MKLKLLNYANMFFAGVNASCVIFNFAEGHYIGAITNMAIMFMNIAAAWMEPKNG